MELVTKQSKFNDVKFNAGCKMNDEDAGTCKWRCWHFLMDEWLTGMMLTKFW